MQYQGNTLRGTSADCGNIGRGAVLSATSPQRSYGPFFHYATWICGEYSEVAYQINNATSLFSVSLGSFQPMAIARSAVPTNVEDAR